MNTRHADPRAAAAIHFFESLIAADLPAIGRLYCSDVRFKDPFNEVRGVAHLQRIFAHMFRTLEAPRFVVLTALVEGNQCFLTWNLVFRVKSQARARRIHGSSHLRFAPDGRIAEHRDYWDAGEEVYEKLPLLGTLLRRIKRRLSVS